jgi:hypothetical protein
MLILVNFPDPDPEQPNQWEFGSTTLPFCFKSPPCTRIQIKCKVYLVKCLFAIGFVVAHLICRETRSMCREMNIAPFYVTGPYHFDVVPCPAFQFESNPAA